MIIITAILKDVIDLGNLDLSKVWVQIDGIDFQADIASFIDDDQYTDTQP